MSWWDILTDLSFMLRILADGKMPDFFQHGVRRRLKVDLVRRGARPAGQPALRLLHPAALPAQAGRRRIHQRGVSPVSVEGWKKSLFPLEEAHKAFPGMFLKDRNFLSWAMWLEQLRYPAPITLLKIGNFQSGFLIAKISSWHWTPFSFPSWFGLFSYSKKPKASQPARQPTSKSVHSKTSRGYIGISHQGEKFSLYEPPLR